MKSINLVLPILFVCLFFNSSIGQFSLPGQLDTTFNFGKPHSYFSDPQNIAPGTGANGSVESIIEVPNGKFFIVGDFQTYNGTTINRVARLKSDGSLDGTFNPGTGANTIAYAAAVQADGKVIVGGFFTSFNGSNYNYLVRLNTDGTVDNAFNTGSGLNDGVKSIVIQADGKILVAGDFTSFNAASRNRILRLNTNGTLDNSFNPNLGANAEIATIAVHPGGKILIGGDFTTYNGVSCNRLARLESNGTLDASFDIGIGANGTVHATAIQSDGSVVIGGSFTSYRGVNRNYIARILPNGQIDASFIPSSSITNFVRSINIQPDGKIVFAGMINNQNSNDRFYINRLNATGSIDPSFFNSNTGFNGSVFSTLLLSNGEILMGGEFTSHQGIPRNRIARLKSNGILDISFNLLIGANSEIRSLAIQSDGRMVLGGFFSVFNDVIARGIVRVFPDGQVDSSFNASIDIFGYVNIVKILPDQRIFVAGNFSELNGVSRNRIGILHSNGSLDTSFNPGIGFSSSNGSSINSVLIQNDGKILVGGNFDNYQNVLRFGIVRLLQDGLIDMTFNAGNINGFSASNSIQDIVELPNNKILVGGAFSLIGGTSREAIARLNPNGTVDGAFNANIQNTNFSGNSVKKISVSSDGKIIIVGQFRDINGYQRFNIARLNSTGLIDTVFNTGSNLYPIFESAATQPDGKVLVTGGIIAPGNNHYILIRFNQDGTLDNSFNSINSILGTAGVDLVVQPNGKVVMVGGFTEIQGTLRNHIARIHTGSSVAGVSEYFSNSDLTQVFPNPFQESVQIKSDQPFQYQVLTLEGKAFQSGFSPNTELNLSTATWASGIYLLRVITDEGVSVKKLVKE